MIELLIGVYAPQTELLQTINEKPPAIVKVVEPTLEEKIKSNFYKCKDTEWIRADNAMCLPKPVATAQTVNKTTPTQKPVRTAENSSNSYEPGQCVWHVKNLASWVGDDWGSASSWASNAQADGYTLSSVPRVGAVAWRYGHVAYVVSVGNGTVVVSEMNYDWVPYHQRTIEVPVDSYQYIY